MEAKEFKDADKEVSKLKTQLAKAEKDGENCNDFRKKYELTKNICLEIEEQVKQYIRFYATQQILEYTTQKQPDI